MAEELNIFKYLDAIYYKKNLKYNSKFCSSYLLSLWLSHDKELLPIVSKLNTLQFTIPDEQIYQYYHSKVPSGKRFIKWTKKTETKEEIEFIKELKEHKSISTQEARIYKNLCTMDK